LSPLATALGKREIMRKLLSVFITLLLAAPAVSFAGEISTYQSEEINATAEEAWALIVNIEKWSEWNPAVAYSELTKGDGESVGSKGVFKPVIGDKKAPFKIKGTVKRSEKPSVIEYAGKLPGMHMTFAFKIEQSDKGVKVTSYEIIKGMNVWLFKLMFGQDNLDKEHRIWVESIKAQLEND
jgi:carbon monoxide dehydrogenase subunit G